MRIIASIVRYGAILMAATGLLLAQAQGNFLQLAQTGSAGEVQAAINAGAAVTARDEYGQTPLMYAAAGNEDPEVITLLINAGANVNAQTEAGWTALMYAVRDNPNPQVVAQLLEHDANPRLTNADGWRALYYASQNTAFSGTTVHSRLRQATVRTDPPAVNPSPPQQQPAQACCRMCRRGKACGDSCINRSYTCHKGPGCACNAEIWTDDALIAEDQQFFPRPELLPSVTTLANQPAVCGSPLFGQSVATEMLPR